MILRLEGNHKPRNNEKTLFLVFLQNCDPALNLSLVKNYIYIFQAIIGFFNV